MTERLFLQDPYLTRFEAEVVGERPSGGRAAVVLSRTAFYPEGGGQPADRGTIGGVPVVDVQEVEGEILHALDGPAPRGRVTAEVEPGRRFDHLQQHHGQHLLSAVFEARLGARTVSFHLGADTCSIDLDAPADRLGPATLAQVERAADELVWRDLPVEAREFTPEEVAALPLRREPTRGSRLVVVRDGDAVVDASPCGGTHPRRTGEVGAITVLRAQRWGTGARVEFVCGARVVALLHATSDALAGVAAALRCAPAEAVAAAGRLAAESLARRKEVERLTALAAQGEADRLADASGGTVAALLTVAGGDAAGWLRAVAQALAGRGRLALLAARAEDGRGLLCFARPRGPGPDLGGVLRQVVPLLGGKGGGAPDLAQGGGPSGQALPEALEAARTAVLSSPA